jgi:hypothetical protein
MRRYQSVERNSAGSKGSGNVGEGEELKIREREVKMTGTGSFKKRGGENIKRVVKSDHYRKRKHEGGEGHKNLAEAWKEFING